VITWAAATSLLASMTRALCRCGRSGRSDRFVSMDSWAGHGAGPSVAAVGVVSLLAADQAGGDVQDPVAQPFRLGSGDFAVQGEDL
jgi:hypothetical protein